MVVRPNGCGIAGLWVIVAGTPTPIRLTGVHVGAQMIDCASEVTVSQRFCNDSAATREDACYVFPLDEQAAVFAFEAQINGEVVVGEVMEKEEARRKYTQAVASGDGAYLMEQDKPDVFEMRLGNLPPQTEVLITIKYVTHLKVESDGAIRFLLPTSVAPRYTPAGATAVPSESATVTTAAALVDVQVDVEMPSPICTVFSETHRIRSDITGNAARVTLEAAELDRDFVFNVTIAAPHEPRVCVEEAPDDGESRVAMLTLVPHFKLQDVLTEFVFVIDRSGSMGGAKITSAKSTLKLLLQSLPDHAYFNIVSFGSRYECLFGQSVRYTEQTFRQASNAVERMGADFGGTEILRPLEAVYAMSTPAGYARSIFVATDGQVSNTEQVLELVRRRCPRTRVFSLGIGANASHHLVDGLARAGRGTAQYVQDGERMQGKVVQQLKDAMQPALNDVVVDWGLKGPAAATGPVASASPEGPEAAPAKKKSLLGFFTNKTAPAPAPAPAVPPPQAPFVPPPVFAGSRFTVYCAVPRGAALPESVTVTAATPEGPLDVVLPVPPAVHYGRVAHRLYGRAQIRDLEEGSSYLHHAARAPSAADVRAAVVALGRQHSLVSAHTSFVAVEKRTRQPVLQRMWTPADPFLRYDVPRALTLSADRSMKASGPMWPSNRRPRPCAAPTSKRPTTESCMVPRERPSNCFSDLVPASPCTLLERRKQCKKKVGDGGGHQESQAVRQAEGLVSKSDRRAPPQTKSPAGPDSLAPARPAAAAFPRRTRRCTEPALMMDSLTAAAGAPPGHAGAFGPPALQALLSTQAFSGFFTDLRAALALVGLAEAALRTKLEPLLTNVDAGQRPRVITTALVVAILRKHFVALHDEWELIAAKADKALSGAGVQSGRLQAAVLELL